MQGASSSSSLCDPCASVFQRLPRYPEDKAKGSGRTRKLDRTLRICKTNEPGRSWPSWPTSTLVKPYKKGKLANLANFPFQDRRVEQRTSGIRFYGTYGTHGTYGSNVVLTFDFFARLEEFEEEKSPGADAPRLASSAFFVYFVV